MLQRDPNSHKGDNGKVMVIGGNEMFHGAPILAALGAEYSGADLVYLWLPPCHAQAARTFSTNFIVQSFRETHLTPDDVKPLLNFSGQADVVVIGPGLGTHSDTKKAIKELLSGFKIPTVVDASALLETHTLPPVTVLTPHRGEFTELTGNEPTPANVQKCAKSLKATIVCKGPKDIISDGVNITINETGNALMTVGGTGDLLAGLIGGLISQHMSIFEAAKLATNILGKAAEERAQHYACLRAFDLAKMIPELLTL